MGGQFLVNTYTVGDQSDSSVAALPDGGFVVSWSSNGQDGSGYGIYSQRYDAAGNPVATHLKLQGTAGSEVTLGGEGIQVIRGEAGNDTLDGGAGADTMIGGDGPDSYFVDHSGYVVTESNANSAVGGTDTVFSSRAAYTLGVNVEKGVIYSLTGAASLTGNALNNILTRSSSGNTTFDGGAGADTMIGTEGDDTYYVDNAGDVVADVSVYAGPGGTDTVYTALPSYTLGDGI